MNSMNDVIDTLDFEHTPVKVLVVNGSPRSENRSRSFYLMHQVIDGVQALPAVEVLTYSFSNKHIAPNHAGSNAWDLEKDDFPEFYRLWQAADAVIWCVPVYHMGPPSLIRAALERLSDHVIAGHKATRQEHLPRPNKVVGTVVNGGSRFGGQEITLMYMMQHAFQMRCLWVSADMPESYHGVAIHVTTDEALRADRNSIDMCMELGRRVVETAKIVRAGMMLTGASLPAEYHHSPTAPGPA
ncbi:MAG: flavodoxin family protein [Anaerolineae bacterium]|nr:flavodoxin family protein [Anaerolineae bacterium]